MNGFSYKIRIDAIDKASKKISRLSHNATRSLDRISKASGRIGQNLNTKVTLPLLGAGAASVKAGYEFEKSMNKVSALTGASFDSKPFHEMQDLALKLGRTTRFSASQAADAMGFLGMAGWETNKILTATPAILNLAAASGVELARAADIASNIMGAFNLRAEEAEKVSDILAKTTASANVDMEMLAETMKFAGPIANKFGLSLEETAAAAGLLGNVGIQGTTAGTAIKNALLGISAPGSQAQKAMKALGVTTSTESGKLRNFGDILKDFSLGLKKIPQAKQLEVINDVFGKIGLAGASELIAKAESGELAAMTEKIMGADAQNAATKMSETLNSGMVGAWNNLVSAFEGGLIALNKSGGLRELFISLAEVFTSVSQKIASLDGRTLKLITGFAGILIVIGPVVTIFSKVAMAISAVIKVVGILWPMISGLVSVFGAIAGAISLPVVAIGALVASLFRLYYAWDKIKKSFTDNGFVSATKAFFGFGDEEDNTKNNPISFGKDVGARESIKEIGKQSQSTGKVKVEFGQAPFPLKTKTESDGMDLLASVRMGHIMR